LCHSWKTKIEAKDCTFDSIKFGSFIFYKVTKIFSKKVETLSTIRFSQTDKRGLSLVD
jgi:hypothetical protein